MVLTQPTGYYVLPVAYALTAVVTGGLAGYLFVYRRDLVSARLVGLVSSFLTIWAIGMGGRLLSATLDGTLLWNTIGYVGIVGTAVAWFLFALQYTGRDRYITRPVIGGLLVPAVVLVVLVGTSGFHSLYYAEMMLAERWGHVVFFTDDTWVLYVFTAWHYLLFVTGAVLIVQFAVHSHRLYQIHSVILVVGAIGPLVLNSLYVFHILGTGFDPTPFAFGVSILLVAGAVMNADFIDVMPVARARVLDVINEAVIVLDRQHRILDVNTQAERLLDGNEGIVGRPAAEYLPQSVIDTEIISDSFAGETPVEVQLPDGTWFLLDRQPIELNDNQIGLILVMVDISQRKRREEELESQNQRLANFTSIVSHDLRNPLGVATGRLELAQQEVESPHLDEIGESLSRMDRIIDDMLWLAQEGRDIGEKTTVNLHDLFEAAWEQVLTRNATLELEVPSGMTVGGDDDRLQQAVENLFRNAIDHGGPDVVVRVGLLEDASGVFVADDGPGIPSEIAVKVFESGFSTETGGAGIGLEIVRGIIEAHGWQVSLGESEWSGARVEITGMDITTT